MLRIKKLSSSSSNKKKIKIIWETSDVRWRQQKGLKTHSAVQKPLVITAMREETFNKSAIGHIPKVICFSSLWMKLWNHKKWEETASQTNYFKIRSYHRGVTSAWKVIFDSFQWSRSGFSFQGPCKIFS